MRETVADDSTTAVERGARVVVWPLRRTVEEVVVAGVIVKQG
jgi:hypothetical protein